MGRTPTMQAPGLYPGTGQAHLLNMNHQYFLWQNMRVLAGQASVAVQLSRMPGTSYPFGAAFQVAFSGAPGTFEVEIQGAEDDVDTNYVTINTITAVNSGNVGRASISCTYPKFVRLNMKTLTNDVNVTGIVTR